MQIRKSQLNPRTREQLAELVKLALKESQIKIEREAFDDLHQRSPGKAAIAVKNNRRKAKWQKTM